MNKGFFKYKAYEHCQKYLHETESFLGIEEAVKQLGGEFLNFDEANSIKFWKLFNVIDEKNSYEALPLSTSCNVPFPYDLDEHEDLLIGENNLEELISNYINASFTEEKFIFSCDPNTYFAIKFKSFDYRFFYIIQDHHTENSLILFDRNIENSFIQNFTMNISILSFKEEPIEFTMAGKNIDFWGSFFREHYQEGVRWLSISGYNHLVKNYGPILSVELPEFVESKK